MQRVISRDPFAPRPAQRSGFWARQFADVSTEKQDRFDVVFGIVLPVICLVLDPIVFQGGFFGERPVLARFQLFAYLFCGLQIGIFLCWRTLARHLAPAAGLIGGVLLAGALFSFIVGILILPLTFLGLIILIGIVGFTPFVTAFVYLRTGIRALRTQQRNTLFQSRFLLAVVMAGLSVVMPALLSHQVSTTISKSVNEILYGNPQEAQVALDRLKWLPVSSTALSKLVDAYTFETRTEKKNVLKRYYKEITGEDIEVNFSND
jgi:hypothetical protein